MIIKGGNIYLFYSTMINLYFKNFNFNLSTYAGIVLFSEYEKGLFIKNINKLGFDCDIISFAKIKSFSQLGNGHKKDDLLNFPLKNIERLFSSKFIILEDLFIENTRDAVLFNAICDFVLHNKIILCPFNSSNKNMLDIYDSFSKNYYENLIVDIFKLRLKFFLATRIISNKNDAFVSATAYLIKEIKMLGFKLAERGDGLPGHYLEFTCKNNFMITLKIHALKNIITVGDEFIDSSKIILNGSSCDIYFNADELINKIKIFPFIAKNIKNLSGIKKREIKFQYDKLSKIQIASVKELNLAHLVIAGAGSGKTRLIVNKFSYLTNFISPDEVLILTFTNNAMEEIRSRIERQRPNDADDNINVKGALNIMTYHSFFYSIVREYYMELGFKSIPKVTENSDADCISYSDIISNIIRLFNDASIVYDIAGRFKYILVDEYQDLDFLSDIIIKKIDAGRGIIMYAGDDDQAIFTFNGGSYMNLLSFDLFYPSGKLFVMQYNYRSNYKIIDFCNSMLKEIYFRFPKKMIQADNIGDASPEKDRINILRFKNKGAEERFLISRLDEYLSRGESVSVLVRTKREEMRFKKEFKGINSKDLFIGTIHKSKGMEFDTVFIANVSAGNIPNSRVLSGIDNGNDGIGFTNHPFKFILGKRTCSNRILYEDELKLFYVAISRAKKRVFITYSGKKSSFLDKYGVS